MEHTDVSDNHCTSSISSEYQGVSFLPSLNWELSFHLSAGLFGVLGDLVLSFLFVQDGKSVLLGKRGILNILSLITPVRIYGSQLKNILLLTTDGLVLNVYFGLKRCCRDVITGWFCFKFSIQSIVFWLTYLAVCFSRYMYIHGLPVVYVKNSIINMYLQINNLNSSLQILFKCWVTKISKYV